MNTDERQPADLSSLLKDLESPADDVRLAALKGLQEYPSVAVLKAVRSIARSDASPAVRFEARKLLSAASANAGGGGPATASEVSAAASVPPESKLQRLVFDLRHDSAQVRAETAKKIGLLRDKRLLGPLSAVLQDEDAAVRLGARQAMREILDACATDCTDPGAVEQLQSQLEAPSAQALVALTRVPETSLLAGVGAVAAALGRRLKVEPNPFVRSALLTALSLVADRATAGLFREFLADPDARVRANAVDAMFLAGDAADWQLAVPLLADPDPRVRAAAVQPALAIYPEPFLGQVRGMLLSARTPDRAAGLFVLRTVRVAERFEMLREHFLQETEPRLLEACAGALVLEASQGRAADLARLVEQLPDGDRRRLLAEAGAANPPPAEAAPPAAPVKSEPEEPQDLSGSFTQILKLDQAGQLGAAEVRRRLAAARDPIAICALIEAVAEQQLPDGVELVYPFASMKDRRVRLAAAAALGQLKQPAACEALGALLGDADPAVAASAVSGIARHGRGPASAWARKMIDSGAGGAARRGLELLAALEDRRELPAVLRLLERGCPPSCVEPLSRLVLAWGDRGTLAELQRIFEAAAANQKPLIAELGSSLGRKLGVERSAIARRFPHGSLDQLTELAGRSSSAWPSATVPQDVRARLWRRARVPLAIALGALALWLLFSTPGPGARQMSGDPHRYHETWGSGSIGFQSREMDSPPAPPFLSVPDEDPRAIDPAPTLEEVEAALGEALAAQGIRSAELVHLVALDRVQDGYRAELARALDAMKRGDFVAALLVLEPLLDQLDPENLPARLAVLKALERASQKARRFERLRQWRDELRAVEKKLMDVLLRAAQDGGMPPDQVVAVMAAIEAQQGQRDDAAKTSDFFSSAALAPELPEDPDDSSGGGGGLPPGPDGH